MTQTGTGMIQAVPLAADPDTEEAHDFYGQRKVELVADVF